MTNHATVYDVWERTGNLGHASVDTVCERLFERAATPRTDYPDANLNSEIATVVDRYGDAAVRAVVQQIPLGTPRRRHRLVDPGVEALREIRGQIFAL